LTGSADADEALSLLRADNSTRLLFTDMKMPGTISGLVFRESLTGTE